jgi:hypothetical protein
LSAEQKIFFSVELHLEPLEVEEKFVFELLSGIDASWRKSGIPDPSSREVMRDFLRVALSPPAKAMAAL